MLPEFETSLPRKASQAEVARPTCRKNGRFLARRERVGGTIL
jgi:hypothetical protein